MLTSWPPKALLKGWEALVRLSTARRAPEKATWPRCLGTSDFKIVCAAQSLHHVHPTGALSSPNRLRARLRQRPDAAATLWRCCAAFSAAIGTSQSAIRTICEIPNFCDAKPPNQTHLL
eukprot:scaffold616_cov257-Pinguiococcus_pyrenoidosus.AAC.8